ncbi:hypothetical protein FOMG_18398 [Fusarium oxysporum f. sp. melonis 26406]|uniref:BZIP domain-containing protein n=1 Tax=Fusarium oxysporum f. sp. melonis 26406 TaxID=1089452 RepID=W9Z9G1_FUSOX|nr:hypothetical protein FOMG_18398 [Fusarium oxysporum f. sp. melonis 26406]
MTSLVDWSGNAHDEPYYDLAWGDMPGGLIPWDLVVSSTIYSDMDASNSEPLLSSPSSEYYKHNVMMGLYSSIPLESPPSLTSVEQHIQHKSRTAPASPDKGATTDSLQDHHGSPSDGTNSFSSQSPPRAELGPPIGKKTVKKTGKKTERKIRGRRLLSNTKGSKGMETELNRAEQKRDMKVLERNRKAAAKCRARKQNQQDTLSAQVDELQGRHKELTASCDELRETAFQLKSELLRHGDYNCTLIQRYIANEAVKSVDNLISNQSPSNSSNRSNSWVTSAPRPGQDGNNGWGEYPGTRQ